MKSIGIIGNGKIGRSVASLLRSENFNVVIADTYNDSETVMVDATDEKQVNIYTRQRRNC